MISNQRRLPWSIIVIISIILALCLWDIHLDSNKTNKVNSIDCELDAITNNDEYVILNAIDAPRKVAYKTKKGYEMIDGDNVSCILVFVDKSISNPYVKIIRYNTYIRYEFYVQNESSIAETKTEDSVSKMFTNIINFKENMDGEL